MATKKESTRSKRWQALLQALIALVIVIFVNILANSRFGDVSLYGALDLTEEGRYTLSPGTRKMLRELDDVVFVRVLLEGEFPAGFKRLQSSTRELLDDFRNYSGPEMLPNGDIIFRRTAPMPPKLPVPHPPQGEIDL